MSDSQARSADIFYGFTEFVAPTIDSSPSARRDSLDDYRVEWLKLFPSERDEDVANGSGDTMSLSASEKLDLVEYVSELPIVESEPVASTAALAPTADSQRTRSIAACVAGVALIAIAGTYDDASDVSAPRTTNPVVATASIAQPALAAPRLLPLPGNAVRPIARFRSAVPRVASAIAARPPISAPQKPRRTDANAIQTVLNRYRDAASTLDVSGIRSVWPSVNAGAVQREFDRLVDQNVDFEACRISTRGTAAAASCAGIVQSGFKARNRRPSLERKRWEFTLRKVGERWMITNVGTHPQ